MTTERFLLSNAELARRGLLGRKDFPESSDQRALLHFRTAVKSGAAEANAPVYSHLTYDVVPGASVPVRRQVWDGALREDRCTGVGTGERRRSQGQMLFLRDGTAGPCAPIPARSWG